MNLSKNAIIALIGLACYTQANGVNLVNNTTLLIVVLALLVEQNEIEDLKTEYLTAQNTQNHGHCACTPNYNPQNQNSGCSGNYYPHYQGYTMPWEVPPFPNGTMPATPYAFVR